MFSVKVHFVKHMSLGRPLPRFRKNESVHSGKKFKVSHPCVLAAGMGMTLDKIHMLTWWISYPKKRHVRVKILGNYPLTVYSDSFQTDISTIDHHIITS